MPFNLFKSKTKKTSSQNDKHIEQIKKNNELVRKADRKRHIDCLLSKGYTRPQLEAMDNKTLSDTFDVNCKILPQYSAQVKNESKMEKLFKTANHKMTENSKQLKAAKEYLKKRGEQLSNPLASNKDIMSHADMVLRLRNLKDLRDSADVEYSLSKMANVPKFGGKKTKKQKTRKRRTRKHMKKRRSTKSNVRKTHKTH